ncbi:hypothetical protein DFJ73DRAFT_831729 [Zopfochytrium polystomum]|nr:hypothetical protein DFJ73DRAFT_831729 [Zopfochytrium polystomum]
MIIGGVAGSAGDVVVEGPSAWSRNGLDSGLGMVSRSELKASGFGFTGGGGAGTRLGRLCKGCPTGRGRGGCRLAGTGRRALAAARVPFESGGLRRCKPSAAAVSNMRLSLDTGRRASSITTLLSGSGGSRPRAMVETGRTSVDTPPSRGRGCGGGACTGEEGRGPDAVACSFRELSDGGFRGK